MSPTKKANKPKKLKQAKKPETITLDTGTVSEVSAAKGLIVNYNEAHAPVVEFLGEPWSGRDIARITAALPRAYRFYKLTTRRQGVTR